MQQPSDKQAQIAWSRGPPRKQRKGVPNLLCTKPGAVVTGLWRQPCPGRGLHGEPCRCDLPQAYPRTSSGGAHDGFHSLPGPRKGKAISVPLPKAALISVPTTDDGRRCLQSSLDASWLPGASLLISFHLQLIKNI